MLNVRVLAINASMYVLTMSMDTLGRDASAETVTMPLLSIPGMNVTRAFCSSARASRVGLGVGTSIPRQRR